MLNLNGKDFVVLEYFFGSSCGLKFDVFYHIFKTKCSYLPLCHPLYTLFFAAALVPDVDESYARYVELKKKGDNAFRQKEFTTAIDFYSQV